MAESVRVIFLGGLGEIGRNCMVIEQGRGDDAELMLIDCGLMFPDADMHGIDLVLPDFSYLRGKANQIVALVLTHGHEDHVGAIQYLLRDDGIGAELDEPLPVYGTELTLGIASNRVDEAGLSNRMDKFPVEDGDVIDVGPFDVEFIAVTHSVPHAQAIAVHTDQGILVHSGDWKLDLTPVDGRLTDLARFGQLTSGDGVRLLMADSTNAEEPGYAPSETSVGGALRSLFRHNRGRRIITASFASHLHRIAQIADAAIDENRKIATLGLSMMKNVRLGRELGVLNIPESAMIPIEDIDDYPPGEVCVISTGSQGEPMSALSRLSRDDNKLIKLTENDTVILSSHAIPGNESNVNKVIDALLRRGAKVVHSGIVDVHATGHAQADEIKTYVSLLQPEWYVPIHGEYRHMVANAALAEMMGVPRTNILTCVDGDVIELSDDGLVREDRVPSGYVYVDGIVGDVGQGVIRDREVLGAEGVVVAVVTVDLQSGKVLVGPDIIPRGWVYAPEAEDLIDEGCDLVQDAVEDALADGVQDVEQLEKLVRRTVGKFVSDRTKRRPMILPIVMET